MKLKNIFSKLSKDQLGKISISGISDDSRLVNKGDLFFIIERRNFDIFSVLKEIEPKVSAFVARSSQSKKLKNIIKDTPIIYVDNIQKEFYRSVDLFYEFKHNDLKFIGVTGTNGKTTTCMLIYHLLKELKIPASLISTVKYCIGPKVYEAERTTPGFLTLRKFLKEAKDSGSHFLIIEVSSHAIEQERIKGIKFERCLFTNLGRDHLDYHKTPEKYFKSKKKLFLDNKRTPALINIDDSCGVKLFRSLPKSLTYGIKDISDFKISKVSLTKSGSHFDIEYDNKIYSIRTQLCGRHNVYNVAGAFGLIASLGISPRKIADKILSFTNVEGRLEVIGENIFIDYAHTPDALETVIMALRNIGYENIISVFGCGGDRDKGKRKLIGQVADKYSDFSFVTSDNPRSEDPELICSQITKGFQSKNYEVVIDRKQAIKKAIGLLVKERKSLNPKNKKSCLLVAGKGHENYQIVGSKKIPFKDSEVIRTIIKDGNNPS